MMKYVMHKIKFIILDLVHPCWRLSGRKLKYFSEDYHEIQIEIELKRINRGPHGFIYGGSLFSATDAIPAFQHFLILGKNYVVWDKEATIRFILPCKEKLCLKNVITANEINEIKSLLETKPKLDRKYTLELVDDAGVVHVLIEKIIHIRKITQEDTHTTPQKRSRFL